MNQYSFRIVIVIAFFGQAFKDWTIGRKEAVNRTTYPGGGSYEGAWTHGNGGLGFEKNLLGICQKFMKNGRESSAVIISRTRLPYTLRYWRFGIIIDG
jgi:hypothetical protein